MHELLASINEHQALVYLTGVFVLGIAAQWLAWRLKFPAILLLLAAGFAAGTYARPDDVMGAELLEAIVALSVAVVLFEGGLTLQFAEIRETRKVVWRLVTAGCLITWGLTTVTARLVFDDWRIATLAGAIFVVTGPTVIVPLLRHVRPIRRVSSIAKWEGILIDPIGALLAVLVFEFVSAGQTAEAAQEVWYAVIRTIAVSVVLGFAGAQLLIQFLKRHWLPDYLHNPVLLATVLLTFTVSNLLQKEAGLGTVTILGIVLANQRSVTITHLVEFKENLGVLLISVLFILMASQLEFSALQELGWQGPVFVAVLILVVRPISVLVATIGTKLTLNERLFLAWLAPRGIVAAAVSSVFASQLPGAGKLVPLTFLLIIGTVSVYGLTAGWLARKLGIADANPQGLLIAGADRWVREIAAAVKELGFTVLLVDTNRDHIRQARMNGMNTCHASIVSEFVTEEIDFAGIGRLLALTPNEQVNSLACVRFVERFGRANLYQLAGQRRNSESSAKRTEVSQPLKGRVLFGEEASHQKISQLVEDGYVIKTTKLSKAFDPQRFLLEYGASALVLFVVRDGSLKIRTADGEPAIQAGDTIIAVVNTGKSQEASPTTDQKTAEDPS